MDVWEWLGVLPAHVAGVRRALRTRALPFDFAHASGNLVIALVAGPELRSLLERYARRLRTEIAWA